MIWIYGASVGVGLFCVGILWAWRRQVALERQRKAKAESWPMSSNNFRARQGLTSGKK